MKHAIATLALLCSASAQAAFINGNDLLAAIEAGGAQRSFAVGYVMAAHDVADGATHCSPIGVTGGQLTDMVGKYLRSAPERRHLAADSLTLYVFASAWPCARKPVSTQPGA